MPQTKFNPKAMAKWYAKQHLKTDAGIVSIYYLPDNAPENEIRFVAINKLIGNRNDNSLEPIDFGIDTGMATEHKLFVLDVTPDQWDRINQALLQLPQGWSLKKFVKFSK